MVLSRVYAIVDGDCVAARGLPLTDAAESLIEGGIRLLQVRWKGNWTRDVFAQTENIAAACRSAGAVFVVNDRPDVALLLDAGVHTGQDDLPPERVRRIVGPDRLVGYSTHNEAQLRQAAEEPVSYIALGPIFGTVSKERPDPVVGVAELARLRRLCPRPLVAIGGITRENAAAVFSAGADSVAVISDLYPQPCTRASVRARAQEWLEIANRENSK